MRRWGGTLSSFFSESEPRVTSFLVKTDERGAASSRSREDSGLSDPWDPWKMEKNMWHLISYKPTAAETRPTLGTPLSDDSVKTVPDDLMLIIQQNVTKLPIDSMIKKKYTQKSNLRIQHTYIVAAQGLEGKNKKHQMSRPIIPL